MSENIVLIIAGVVIFFVGLAKQRGGLKLSNFGINIGSTNTQSINVATSTSGVAPSKKRDWVGHATKAVGLLAALVGLVRALNG
jgi:hypothetical protein